MELGVEAWAEEAEEECVECDGGEGDEGAEGFGEVEGVAEGEDGDEEDGGEDVGEEDGEEAAGRADRDGDGVALVVFLPAGRGDSDEGILLFRELAAGVGGTRGAAAEACDADLHLSVGCCDDGAWMICYGLHDLGAFLQFLTQRPRVSILCIWPL